MANGQYTPEQYQALFGQMLGKELEQMQKENENFDPRGSKAEEIDKMTSSLVDGFINSQRKDTYDARIQADINLKYVVDTLISNPIIIPYIATYVDKKVGMMKKTIEDLMAETFKVEES